VRYRVRHASVGPSDIVVNGVRLSLTTRDRNPYRTGGWRVSAEELAALLGRERNVIEIEL
jgi:hypothetical protein